jgi:hypothetical protein
MSDQDTSLPAVGPGSDFYSQYQSAEHTLNTAIAEAKISETFEKYLEIIDDFYADDVEVTSEDQPEPIRGKARVGNRRTHAVHSTDRDTRRCRRRDAFRVDTRCGWVGW